MCSSDLVGARRVFVMTDHNTKNGEPKLVRECSYPLTGTGVVSTVYTDLAVIDVTDRGLTVREKVEALTFDELQSRTGADLLGMETCGILRAPSVS